MRNAGLVVMVALPLCGFQPRQPWKTKPPAQWSVSEARLVLADSPWAKPVNPQLKRAAGKGSEMAGASQTMRRGGYARGGTQSPEELYQLHPAVTVRWESALPIREAEAMAGEVDAPDIEQGNYAIAVYGVQSRFPGRDAKSLAGDFKKHAMLKREGKPDIKPASVEVIMRDTGIVAVFQFPRSAEITQADREVQFEAQMGPLFVTHGFVLAEMVVAGKREL